MALPFFKKKKQTSTSPDKRKKLFRPRREDVLFWGTIGLILFFIVVIAGEGALFYRIVVRKRMGEVAIPVERFKKISSSEIDKVLELLHEREKQFSKIMGVVQ